jgi:hypothetical protein
VKWNSDAASASAIENGRGWISEEVLALSFERDSSLQSGDEELGLALKLSKV